MAVQAASQPKAREAPGGPPLTTLVFFAFAIGGFAIGTMLFGYFAVGNYDEELLLYASNLVYDGQLPYKDFPYSFGPVLPFVYGVPQALLGPSVLLGRMTSASLSIVTAVSGSFVAYRFSRKLGVLVFLALILLNPLMLWIFTVTKTESLVTPLVMTSLAVWIARPRDRRALVVAASLLLWAVSVRQTIAPAFIVLTAVIFFQMRDSKRDMALAGVALVLQGLLLFGVLALLARGNMLFHLVELQLAYRTSDYSPGDRLLDLVTFYPQALRTHFIVLLIPIGAVLVVFWHRWRRGWRPSLKALDADPSSAQLLLMFAAVLIFLPHLLLRWPQTHYFVVSSALLAAAAGSAVGSLAQVAPTRLAGFAPSAMLVVILIGGGLLFWSNQESYIDTSDPYVQRVADVNEYVRITLGPDERVVAFSPGYALVDGLPLPPELTMGIISYANFLPRSEAGPYLTTEEVRRRKMIDWVSLNDLIADPRTQLVILGDGIVNWLILPFRDPDYSTTVSITAFRDLDLDPSDPQQIQLRYLREFPGLDRGGYRLDEQFEEEFRDRIPGTHAFVR